MYVGKATNSDSTMANAAHHRVDGFASIVVVIGILGAQCGLTWFDPIAGLFVAAIICKAAIGVCYRLCARWRHQYHTDLIVHIKQNLYPLTY